MCWNFQEVGGVITTSKTSDFSAGRMFARSGIFRRTKKWQMHIRTECVLEQFQKRANGSGESSLWTEMFSHSRVPPRVCACENL